MNEDVFVENLNELGIKVTKKQVNQFELYKALLQEWNKKINLTAIIDDNEIMMKHFIDSLTINKYLPKNARLIDVGTGAGFPGIPLKIINDGVKLTLLDALNKRINFLKMLCGELEINNNVEFIHGRAEDYGQNKDYREFFDVVTARAVANMRTLSEECIPFLKLGGIFVCMKGNDIESELNEAKDTIKLLGGKIEKVDEFILPGTDDVSRTVIIIRKENNTPEKYPRKAGTF